LTRFAGHFAPPLAVHAVSSVLVLGAENVVETVTIALRLGLIDPMEDTTSSPCCRSRRARRSSFPAAGTAQGV